METIKPPSNLNLTRNVAENWKTWKQRFELYIKAAGLKDKSDEQKCAILLHCIGEDAIDVFNSFVFTEEETDKYDILVKRFEDYAIPKRNPTAERIPLNRRKQIPGESFDKFVTDLKNKAKTCTFR